MAQCKECAQCGATFYRKPHRSHAQWAKQTCCTTVCANTWRAYHCAGSGADFSGGSDHGWKVRRAWAESPRGKKAARKKQRKEKLRAVREAERNLRLQLELWPRLCSDCATPIPKGHRYCDTCAVHRKREQRRQWNDVNPDYDRLYQQARKVLQRDAIGKCSPTQARARFDFYGGCCAYCRVELVSWHWDHVIPLSRGGTNWPANLRPSCAECNRSKSAKPYQLWTGVREARLIAS